MSGKASDDFEKIEADEHEAWIENNFLERGDDGRVKRRRGGWISTFKQERDDAGAGCEACGWRPTEAYRAANPDWWKMLDAHHVIPVACWGTDKPGNIIILCPTCHAFADRTGRITGRYRDQRTWTGPTDRETLLAALRAARSGEIHPSATPSVTPAKNEEAPK